MMFGFEIDKAQLITVGLNAAGYLAAGGLSVMFYSMVTKRRWRRMFAEIIEQGAAVVSVAQQANHSELNHATGSRATSSENESERQAFAESASETIDQFVSFDNIGGSMDDSEAIRPGNAAGKIADSIRNGRAAEAKVSGAVSRYKSALTTGGNSSHSGSYTRNRADVIRMAREMLASGQSSESVRRELPINESEMRLVELGSRG